MRRPRPVLRAGLLSAAALIAVAMPAVAATPVDAVTTPGRGALTMCRSWVVYQSCNTYHKVALPPEVAVGDDVAITYGSNPKDITFHVARILRHGDRCRILNNAGDDHSKSDRIEIENCRPMGKPAAASH